MVIYKAIRESIRILIDRSTWWLIRWLFFIS